MMFRAFSLVFLSTVMGFQQLAVPARRASPLQMAPYRQLSDAEMRWYKGTAKTQVHEYSEEELESLIHGAKARIAKIEDAIAKGNKQMELPSDDCDVEDPRLECMLSPVERGWALGTSGEHEEFASIQEELQVTKDHLADYETKLAALKK